MPGVEGQKAQLLKKRKRPVFYAVEQVGQVSVEVVVDLHALAVRRPAEQHPTPAAKDFDVSAKVLGEEPVYDIAEGFFAAHPADKAINFHHLPLKRKEPIVTTFSVTSTRLDYRIRIRRFPREQITNF